MWKWKTVMLRIEDQTKEKKIYLGSLSIWGFQHERKLKLKFNILEWRQTTIFQGSASHCMKQLLIQPHDKNQLALTLELDNWNHQMADCLTQSEKGKIRQYFSSLMSLIVLLLSLSYVRHTSDTI